jgi:hypothetical protein
VARASRCGIEAHYIWIDDILLFMGREREAGRLKGGTRSTLFGKFSIFKQSLDLPEGYQRGCKRDKLRVEGHWWNDLEFAGGVKVSRDFWLLVASQPQASANTS